MSTLTKHLFAPLAHGLRQAAAVDVRRLGGHQHGVDTAPLVLIDVAEPSRKQRVPA